MQYDENAEKYGYEGEMTPMKCDELKAYKGDVTIPVYGTIADAEVYLKEDADTAIAELNQAIDKLVGVKKSAEQILQNLLDCGLIKEWYFNGKFNFVLKSDDPHLQIAELKKENERLKDKLRHYPMMAALIGSDNKEIRRLQRALWLARAWAASNKYQMFCFSDHIGDLMNIHGFIQRYQGCSNMKNAKEWQQIWERVECKCRAKAEEYK